MTSRARYIGLGSARALSPCPACARGLATEIIGGAVVRERCPSCFPARPFLRPAVEAVLPAIVDEIKRQVSAATGLDPSCFEITEPEPDLPGQITATVIIADVETCSTCGRSERLFESVEACRGPSRGECRFALRRVE